MWESIKDLRERQIEWLGNGNWLVPWFVAGFGLLIIGMCLAG